MNEERKAEIDRMVAGIMRNAERVHLENRYPHHPKATPPDTRMKSTDPSQIKVKSRINMTTPKGIHAHVLIEHTTNRTIYVYGNKDMAFNFDLFCEVGERFKHYFEDWHSKQSIAVFDQDGEYYEYLK